MEHVDIWMEKEGVIAVGLLNTESYFSIDGCVTDPEKKANEVYPCLVHRLNGDDFEVGMSHAALVYLLNGGE
jgi:hypothetical protein